MASSGDYVVAKQLVALSEVSLSNNGVEIGVTTEAEDHFSLTLTDPSGLRIAAWQPALIDRGA